MMERKPDPTGGMPPDDSDIAEMFHHAFGDVRAGDNFIAALAERLDAEFQALHNVSAHDASARGISSPCETLADETNDSANAVVSGRPDLSSDPELRSTAPYRRRRLLTAVAIAVSVLVVAAVWSTRPSYSWASMVRALEIQPWIQMAINQTASETSRSQRVRHWFSREHRVAAMRSANQAVFDDAASGVRSRYQVGQRVVTRAPLPEGAPITAEAMLLQLLLRGVGPSADSPANASLDHSLDGGSLETGSIEIGRQSWREIEDADGKWIELSVEVFWGKKGESRLNLVLLLDPRTKLPRQCRVANGRAVYQFDYPREGPRDVYKLGVPRDAAVVDSTLNALSSHNTDHDTDHETQTQNVAATANRSSVASPAEMARRVDALLEACWARNGLQPVSRASDVQYVRRAYLDLTGRIPSVSEAREHIKASSSAGSSVAWREKLIKGLLVRRDHATHLASVWRGFLLPDGVDLARYGGTSAFDSWLAERFRDNVPYDAIVRELLLAEGRAKDSGPMLFYTAMQFKPEAIAEQTARAFLGVRMECAQCHDHPFDKRWKQEDFWGYAAFFARISRPKAKIDMISPVLRVHDSHRGEVTLPHRDEIVAPRIPLGESIKDESDGVSRRRRLADWLTAADNPHFSRATVNRVWAHLFGRAIVAPVDDIRDGNQTISPEVLDELAGYFVASGFDLRQLFQAIALSKAYQLSSRSSEEDPTRTRYFAQMNIKIFTPQQLYDSIGLATRLEPLGGKTDDEKSLLRLSNMTRQAFIEQFRAPPGQATDYQAGIPQALTMMNGQLIHNATDLERGGILRSLQAPFLSDSQRLEVLFLATLSRLPRDDEREELLHQIRATDNNEDKLAMLADVLWALLNSAEFTLNH